jgi:HEAT repeat protein
MAWRAGAGESESGCVMKKSWWIGWSLFLAAILASLVVLLCGPVREPEYQGRTLTRWIHDFQNEPPMEQTNSILAIRQMGSNAVPFLVAELRAKDSQLNRKLADLLGGPPTGPYHLRRDSERRMDALLALQWLGPDGQQALPEVARLLDKPDTSEAAAYTVYAMGPAAIPTLRAALTNPMSCARASAIEVLALTRDPQRIPDLIAALKTPDPAVRDRAAWALQHFPEATAVIVPALMGCLDDPDSRVRESAAISLAVFGPAAKPALPQILKLAVSTLNPRMTMPRAAMAIDVEATLTALTNTLASGSVNDRRVAARSLGVFWGAGGPAVPALVKSLKDADAEVRVNAALALGEIRKQPEVVVPALMENLSDPDLHVRKVAAVTLAIFGPQARAAVPDLLKIIAENTDKDFRSALKNALEQIDPEAAKKLSQE